MADDDNLRERDFSPGYLILLDGMPETLNLTENEKHLIISALDKHSGNISKAAIELGIERTALHRRIKKYGI